MATFNFKRDLEQAPFEDNLAEYLDQSTLDEMGARLKIIAEQDRDSRQDWMDQNKEWLRLASQVQEDKSFPWPGCSNIKYPLLTIAAMQFHARALPNLIPDDRPVKAKINGRRQPGEEKQKRADRVSEYMSFQILDEQEEWLDELDRMLFVLPMVGVCYKKTYYSTKYRRNKSELILPNEMYINYYAKNFEGATKTHLIPVDPNTLVGLQRQGIYLDVDLPVPSQPRQDPNDRKVIDQASPSPVAHDTPYELYEIECWWDLDEDGYKEPYLVTIESTQGTVLRVIARWKPDAISYNNKGEVAEISDYSQVTPYIFLPDPASATSGLGLGSLLGPLNEAVNTLTNQLVDAGTLSNMQCGFLAKGINLRGGATKFRPGEWKIVNATGDDMRKSVMPLPVNEPSQVLFQLLGLLLESGERLGSVTDMMVGDNPGQNQKATTSMIVQEQGMAVYSSIYKRIYRALSKEFSQFYQLNFEFLDERKYNEFFDDEQEVFKPRVDFNIADMDVLPGADPSTITDSQRAQKAQGLIEMAQMGTVNPQIATQRVLEAQGQTDIEELMNIPKPPPSIEEREMALKEKLEPARLQLESLELRIKAIEGRAKAEQQLADKNKKLAETVTMARQQELERAKLISENIHKRIELLQNKDKGDSDGKPRK